MALVWKRKANTIAHSNVNAYIPDFEAYIDGLLQNCIYPTR